jgi:hypothetical protein
VSTQRLKDVNMERELANNFCYHITHMSSYYSHTVNIRTDSFLEQSGSLSHSTSDCICGCVLANTLKIGGVLIYQKSSYACMVGSSEN